MKKYKITALLLAVLMLLSVCSGCGGKDEAAAGAADETTAGAEDDKRVVIYTTLNVDMMSDYTQHIQEKFPDYELVVEYFSTGELVAKIMAEGADTDCDIIFDITYDYMDALEDAGDLANISDIVDFSQYVDTVHTSDYYAVTGRYTGTVIVNTDMLERLGLPEPTSWEDLLDPQYKDLILMTDPNASGSAYLFIKHFINLWGEEGAYDYLDKLSENVLQFNSSGSGSINSLVQEEVAIALASVRTAAQQIAAGDPLKILQFDGGCPNTFYGQAIVAGKETRQCVRDVFAYTTGELLEYGSATYNPEKIFKDKDFTVDWYPDNIDYADMGAPDSAEKERVLSNWAIPEK